MARVLIADDHPVVRQGLKEILSDASEDFGIDEAVTGPEVLEKTWKNSYDVVLLDINLPGLSGLEVLKELKKQKPGLPVLMLSVYEEDQYALRCMRAGAAGYLTKQAAPEELLNAIRRILAGRKYVGAGLAEKLVFDLTKPPGKKPHEILSDREFEILVLLARGQTLGSIAGRLHLSPKTISTYRTRLLAKMNMKTNAELVKYALEHKLVD